MKTEAEIREAIQHLEDALRGGMRLGIPEEQLANLAMLTDILRWTLGDTNAFDAKMAQYREVDRMRESIEKAGLN